MDEIIAFKRPDDGKLFTLNQDGTYSLDWLKKEFPNHIHQKYPAGLLAEFGFEQIFKYEEIKLTDKNNMKNKLIILMGPSGSGKSTKANKLAAPCCICEVDKFWLNCTGEYLFVPSLLGKAHSWCQSEVERLMKDGKATIVVSNTSLTEKERKPYKDLAKKYDYDVSVELPDSPWFLDVRPRLLDKTFTDEDVNLFVSKSTHGVPFEGIKRMFQKYSEN